MNQNVFNKEGDFITSPEISQLFGEMIGIWIVMFLEKKNFMDTTKPRTIVEIGPGTGNLQMIILNTLRQFGLLKNLTITMIEVSPYLRNVQQSKLNDFLLRKDIFMEYKDEGGLESLYNSDLNLKIGWQTSYTRYIETDNMQVTDNAHIFLCHEFFDALPSLKFRYKNGEWHEVLIDNYDKAASSDQVNLSLGDKHFFKEILSPANPKSVELYLKPAHRFATSEISENQDIEISPLSIIIRLDDSEYYKPKDCYDRWGRTFY